jgi:hypothetical protein
MPEESPQSESAIALRESAANPLAQLSEIFTDEQRDVIANFVGVTADDPGFLPFLATAASLELSPLTGEIWLIKGRKYDKAKGDWVDFYKPAVGRDGYLKNARKDKRFKSVRSGTVCANDTFEVEDDGETVKMLHRFATLPPDVDPLKASRYRGPVIGAWAKVFFKDGSEPFFHYTTLHEHAKTKIKNGEVDWEGSWSYTSEMIEKCALSYVLRIAFSITGAVPVDELVNGELTPKAGEESIAQGARLDASPHEDNDRIVTELAVSEDLKRGLREALFELNELVPFSWSPNKTGMYLTGADETKANQTLEQIEKEIAGVRKREAVEAERQAKATKEEKASEEKVQDAREVLAAEDVEPGMVILVSEQSIEVSGVIAREGKIIFGYIADLETGREAEGPELDPKDEVEILARPKKDEKK